MAFDKFGDDFEENDDLWTNRDYDLSDFTLDDVDLTDNKFLMNQAMFEEEGRLARETEREMHDFDKMGDEIEKDNLRAEYKELKEKRRKTSRDRRRMGEIKEYLDSYFD